MSVACFVVMYVIRGTVKRQRARVVISRALVFISAACAKDETKKGRPTATATATATTTTTTTLFILLCYALHVLFCLLPLFHSFAGFPFQFLRAAVDSFIFSFFFSFLSFLSRPLASRG